MIPTIRQIRLRDIRPEALTAPKTVAGSYFNRQNELCDDNTSSLNGNDLIAICTNGVEQFVRPD